MLTVNEIFFSIQGEGTRAGRPSAFLRLTGCPLRCVWCDTAYAFHEGERREEHAVLAERATVLFSPVRGVLDAGILGRWILEDGLPVRLQIQLHKSCRLRLRAFREAGVRDPIPYRIPA